jgi:phosphoribosylformimino-5-aminoimidazole carboxamide ribotide isomerase
LLVIPAIDLSEGQVVRLRRGEMEKRTVYSPDPAAVARRWVEAGAELIHVVDLDGAVAGEPRNLRALEAIAAAAGVPIQFGGGLRTQAAVAAALAAGAQWVILGTAALTDPALLEAVLAEHRDRLVVALDARHGRVAIRGWRQTSEVEVVALAQQMQALGVRRLLYTNIARDGMLTGPDLDGLRRLAQAVQVPILASGGVACLEDVRALRRLAPLGIIGVVVGRALYEGRLNLRAAIAVARE